MKKRQVMALILAVALAVPSVSLGSNMAVGVPASVEAAATAVNEIDVKGASALTITRAKNFSEIKSAVNVLFGKQIKLPEGGAKASSVITVGKVDLGVWTLEDKQLEKGKNALSLKFTFDDNVDLNAEDFTGEGWEKVNEFPVTVEAVETVEYGDVLGDKGWPVLYEKEYDKDKSKKGALWEEDVNAKKNSYGTFSAAGTAEVTTAGSTVPVTVTFTLNDGYVFANDYTNGGVAVEADTKICTKVENVTVNKKTIKASDIAWPKLNIDASKTVYGNKMGDAIKLPDNCNTDLIEFALVKTKGSDVDNPTDDEAFGNDTVFEEKGNTYYIKATLKDAAKALYQFERSAGAYYSAEQSIAEEQGLKLPIVTKAEITSKYLPAGKGDDEANYVEGSVVPTTAQKIVLTAEPVWNVTDAIADDAKVEPHYQWYGTNGKIEGATSATYEAAPGSYYCEVSMEHVANITKEEMAIWKEQKGTEAIKSDSVDVVKSDIAVSVTGLAGTYTYGSIDKNLTGTATLTGAGKDATAAVVITDADDNNKDITSQVGNKIAVEKNGNVCTITVDKSIGAGNYNISLAITDGQSRVVLPVKTPLAIGKQELTITAARIKNTDVNHGDQFDKLKFSYEPATGTMIADKEVANQIANITLADEKTAFSSKGYVAYAGSGNVATDVLVSLKDNKNYDIASSGVDKTGLDPGMAKVSVTVKVSKKPITLSVETTKPMLQGSALPELKINGADFREEDKVEVSIISQKLCLKSDESQKEVGNDIKNLKAGEYIIKPVFGYKINDVGGKTETEVEALGYDVTPSNSNLTIYNSVHIVGFVTYGDTNLPNKEVGHGDVLAKPADPTRAGYKFAGWYTDKDFKNAYDFSKAVEGDFNLYAKWEKVSGTNGGQNSADAVKAGTTTKTSAGTFAVINASTRTVAYKAASKSAKKVTVPSSVTIKGVSYKVTKIDNNAFKNCKKLTKVSIPSTVTEIGTAAFKGCKKLTSVTIPKNVNKIGKEAFSGCSKLKKVTIKSTKIKSVGKNAFKGIARKSAIKTPKSKKAAYKKILKKSGYKKTVK